MDDVRAKLAAGLAALAVAAAVALVALGNNELATTALGLAGTMGAYVLGLGSDPHTSTDAAAPTPDSLATPAPPASNDPKSVGENA